MSSVMGRLRAQGLRVLALAGLLLVSGAAIGLAVAYPLTFVNFDQSNAPRLDQVTLAGQVARLHPLQVTRILALAGETAAARPRPCIYST